MKTLTLFMIAFFITLVACGDLDSSNNGKSRSESDEIGLTDDQSFNTENDGIGSDDSETLTISKKELELESAEIGLEGIIRYVSAHYQSCAPLLRPNVYPKIATRRNFEKPLSHTHPGLCVDRRNSNTRYLSFGNLFDAKGSEEKGEVSLNPEAGRMRLRNGELDSFQRVHCSGALTGTIMAGNQKYFVGQTKKDYSPNTTEFEKMLRQRDNHCFYNPELSTDFSLLPGDILNVSAAHAVRVYQIGEDPLGLKQVQRVEDCDKIKKSNFDFTIVHSTSTNYTDGYISGVHFQRAADATPNMIGKFAQAVREMCKKTFADGKVKGKVPRTFLGVKERFFGLWKEDQYLRLLRHQGRQKAGCLWNPEIPVRQESCIKDSCYDQVYQRSFFPSPTE